MDFQVGRNSDWNTARYGRYQETFSQLLRSPNHGGNLGESRTETICGDGS